MKISSLLPWGVFLISAMALTIALVAQHVFWLEPCELCLMQRVPFMVTGILGVVAVLVSHPRLVRALMMVCALAFLLNSGLAFFHVGVEQGWWQSACSGGSGPVNVNDLMSSMSQPAQKSCSEPAWSYQGITMAAMNVVFCLGLAVLTFLGLRRIKASGL